jgi:DNA-binding MarR family transcriptional regulator
MRRQVGKHPSPPSDARGQPMAMWISLTRIRRRLERVVERRLKRAGLPPLIWHDALLLLASQRGGELSALDLQQRLSLPQYQMSRLIERLAEGGLVIRRRLLVVGRPILMRLTERGRDLQQRMMEIYASAVEAEVTGQFSEQEAADLVALLSRVYRAPSVLSETAAGVSELRCLDPERHMPAELAE